jgi:hypothetical protein
MSVGRGWDAWGETGVQRLLGDWGWGCEDRVSSHLPGGGQKQPAAVPLLALGWQNSLPGSQRREGLQKGHLFSLQLFHPGPFQLHNFSEDTKKPVSGFPGGRAGKL